MIPYHSSNGDRYEAQYISEKSLGSTKTIGVVLSHLRKPTMAVQPAMPPPITNNNGGVGAGAIEVIELVDWGSNKVCYVWGVGCVGSVGFVGCCAADASSETSIEAISTGSRAHHE